MRLLISKEMNEQGTIVRVAGRLAGSGVTELDRVCRVADHPLYLQLSDLRSADSRGVRLLKTLQEGGAEFLGVSSYLTLLIHPEKP